MTAPVPISRSDLRIRILSVASDLFADRGFAATTMRAVADASDCTKPALYYYFENKQQLFVEALNEELAVINRIMVDSASVDTSLRDQLTTGIGRFCEHVNANPNGYRLMLRADMMRDPQQPDFDLRSHRQTHREILGALIAAAIENGEVDQGTNLNAAIGIISGAVEHACLTAVVDQIPIPDDYPKRIIDLVFRGLKP